jgi:hypothetical protein
MSLDGAVPQEEIIDVFKGKRDRSKNLKKKQKFSVPYFVSGMYFT